MKYLPPRPDYAPSIHDGERLVAYQGYNLSVYKNGDYAVDPLPIWAVMGHLTEVISILLEEKLI